MIKNGHLVINLKVVGIVLGAVTLLTIMAGMVGIIGGLFSYIPEVTSVTPVPEVTGAYLVTTTEEPNDGAIWFGFESRNGSYIVMPDNSVVTYPALEAPSDLGPEILVDAILKDMKRKLLEAVIAKLEAQKTEGELVSTQED